MRNIRKIQIKRTSSKIDNVANSTPLDAGEPLLVYPLDGEEYLLFGRPNEANDSTTIEYLDRFKAHPKDIVDLGVYYTDNGLNAPSGTMSYTLTDDNGNKFFPYTSWKAVTENGNKGDESLESKLNDIGSQLQSAENKKRAYSTIDGGGSSYVEINKPSANISRLYLLSATLDVNGSTDYPIGGNTSYKASKVYGVANGIYINPQTGVLYGAGWNNDYAETRKTTAYPGECVVENGSGELVMSDAYLLPTGCIVSDTFGHVLGLDEDEYKPIALAGRVLAYVDESRGRLSVGDAVGTAPDGKVAKMTRHQIRKYPDRIVGIVSEIPTYDKWGSVEVGGRVWIKIK